MEWRCTWWIDTFDRLLPNPVDKTEQKFWYEEIVLGNRITPCSWPQIQRDKMERCKSNSAMHSELNVELIFQSTDITVTTFCNTVLLFIASDFLSIVFDKAFWGFQNSTLMDISFFNFSLLLIKSFLRLYYKFFQNAKILKMKSCKEVPNVCFHEPYIR